MYSGFVFIIYIISQIFSQSSFYFSFYSFTVSFEEQNFLIFVKAQLSFLSYVDQVLRAVSKNNFA